MPSEFMTQMARDRALMMAQSDFQHGVIKREEIIAQARQYESYLIGKPVLATEKKSDPSSPAANQP